MINLSVNSSSIFRYFSKNWIVGNNKKSKNIISEDEDTTLLPEDLLIKNVIWRWRRAQGLSFSDYLREFDTAIDMEAILCSGG
ncbi:hypothetical protein [Candidatus Liberibacter brunswickensis]|uniref:hypothetical protein n=1 Tax=Candidatus Liberibacter brunswickensis TaxID=1968796 RepID=UPI002FE20443